MMDADEGLIRAFDLGMGDAGWTEEVMDEAELLLPTLVAAGCAARGANTWWFTKEGVARHDEIVIEGLH
jgi:hypothetical protein